MTRRAIALGVALAASFLAGCAGSSSSGPEATGSGDPTIRTTFVVNPPPVQVEQRTVQVGEVRLSLPVPKGEQVRASTTVQVGDCAVQTVRVPTAVGNDVEISSVPDGCDLGPQRSLNGYRGYYRWPDEMEDVSSWTFVSTALGIAQVATMTYTECTNSCSSADTTVALLTIDAAGATDGSTLQILELLSPANHDQPKLDFPSYLHRITAA